MWVFPVSFVFALRITSTNQTSTVTLETLLHLRHRSSVSHYPVQSVGRCGPEVLRPYAYTQTPKQIVFSSTRVT